MRELRMQHKEQRETEEEQLERESTGNLPAPEQAVHESFEVSLKLRQQNHLQMHAGDVTANETSSNDIGRTSRRHTQVNGVSKEKVTGTRTSPRNANQLKRIAKEENSNGSVKKNTDTKVIKKIKSNVRGQHLQMHAGDVTGNGVSKEKVTRSRTSPRNADLLKRISKEEKLNSDGPVKKKLKTTVKGQHLQMHAGDVTGNGVSEEKVTRSRTSPRNATRMSSVSEEKVTRSRTSSRNADLLKRISKEEKLNSDGPVKKKLKTTVKGQASLQDRGSRNSRQREAATGRPRAAATGRPRGAATGRPRGAADGRSRGAADARPRGAADARPRGAAADGRRRAAADGRRRAAADGRRRAAADGRRRAAADGRPRGAANGRPRGAANGRPRGAANGRQAVQLEEAEQLDEEEMPRLELVRIVYGNMWIPDLGKCAIDCCKAGDFTPLFVRFVQEISPEALVHKEVRKLEEWEENSNLICFLAERNLSLLIILLVNNGFHVDYELDENLRTLLIIASQYGYLCDVNLLLCKGADVHKFDSDTMTPLHYAAKNDHFLVVKKLVEYGADVNAKTRAGFTPLHYACINECIEVIEYLLEHGADLFIKSNVGIGALWYCTSVFGIDFFKKYSKHK